jgi:HEAT repeat protein
MRPAARVAVILTLLGLVAPVLADPPENPEFQGKKGSEWVDVLLNDTSARQRSLAAVALGRLWTDDKTKYKPALATLGRAIKSDASPAVRSKVLSVVSGFAPDDVAEFLSGDLVQALEGEKDPRVRKELATTVGLFPKVAKKGVVPLTGYLKDADPATRAAAADALGRAGQAAKESVAELLPLLKDTDATVRRAAAFALGRVSEDDSAAASALAKLLADEKESAVRREAIISLGLLSDRSGLVIQAVGSALSDADPEIRRAAVRALARFGPAASPAADALLKTAREDKDQDIRVAAVRAFALALGPGLKGRVKDLYPVLDDPVPEVRIAVIEELGALGNALKDDAETLSVLRKRLSDPQAKVRQAAAEAIKRIEKVPPPPDKKP